MNNSGNKTQEDSRKGGRSAGLPTGTTSTGQTRAREGRDRGPAGGRKKKKGWWKRHMEADLVKISSRKKRLKKVSSLGDEEDERSVNYAILLPII